MSKLICKFLHLSKLKKNKIGEIEVLKRRVGVLNELQIDICW